MLGLKHRGWIVWVIAAVLLAACGAAQAPSASAPAAGGGMADSAAPAEAVAQSPEGEEAAAATNRKMIAHANLAMVVEDTQATVDEITAMLDEVGGFVSTTNLFRNSYGDTQTLQGSLTLRVPTENLDATLDRLAAMAVSVESRSLNREDVTDQYSDVDAQIRNLEATEVELRAMLEEVRARPNSTSEDIMAVYRTLTEVRGQIEQLRGRKNMWDNLIALSTIEVTLYPDSTDLPVVDESWRPGTVAREAQRALVDGLQVLGNVAIWFSMFLLPLMLLALIPIVLAIWLLRLLFRRMSKTKTTAVVPPAAT